MRHLFRLAVAAQRRAAVGEGRLVGVGDAGGHAGVDRARADAVDRDPFLAELDRERAGQAGDRRLGRRRRRESRAVAPSASVEAMLTMRGLFDLRR